MLPFVAGLPTYPMFFVAGFAVGWLAIRAVASGNGIRSSDANWIAGWAAFGMIVGGKLHSLAERGAFADPIGWEAIYGYRYPGGLFGAVAALWLYSRANPRAGGLLARLDLLVPGLGFASVVIRFGCFLSGCCFGRVSALPWAIAFPAPSRAWHVHHASGLIPPDATHSLPVHPLQLYLAGLCVILGVVCFWLYPRRRYDGEVAFWYLLLHGTSKFALEFVRYEFVPSLAAATALMAFLGAIGIARWRSSPAA